MIKNRSGLTILEALVVMTVSIVLLWIVIPVGMVRLGWKEAGSMVVTEGDKAPEYKGVPLELDVLKPRVDEVQKPRVLPDSQFVPRAPNTPPKKNPLE
ncbi:MAG: hypothetical protein WAW39_01670 [Prosthecobacter sp.]|uniref:hypothetical protein n=1 Tax=Prosthecobacter sp. TaxID=1965333 RepID=UPI003BB19945